MSQRIAEIAARADAVLEDGERREVLALLALLAGRFAVAQIRARELRELATSAPARVLTVKDATTQFPVSRSFLYEHGEQLGILHRPPHGRVVVIESRLRAYLEGRRG